MHRYWFAVTLCVALQALSQNADPWLVAPGKSVGPITAQTLPGDLRGLFGARNVKDAMVSSGGDAEPGPATVVHGDDLTSALTIFWDKPGKGLHPASTAHLDSINLCYGNANRPETCKWHLANNVSFGTSLRELERLNRRPFHLEGFGWDYSGTVMNWNGGDLERLLNRCGRLLLRLEPRYSPIGPTAEQQKVYEQATGDRDFLSSNPAMQQLNPVVYAIVFVFPTGNCPAL